MGARPYSRQRGAGRVRRGDGPRNDLRRDRRRQPSKGGAGRGGFQTGSGGGGGGMSNDPGRRAARRLDFIVPLGLRRPGVAVPAPRAGGATRSAAPMSSAP